MIGTRLEIIGNAIAKAKQGGYTGPDYSMGLGHIIDGTNYMALIFRPDFCKSIWGEVIQFLPYDSVHAIGEEVELWKWHVRQMSVHENPLEYLESNLEQDSWEKILVS
jgi:hypothetical protein